MLTRKSSHLALAIALALAHPAAAALAWEDRKPEEPCADKKRAYVESANALLDAAGLSLKAVEKDAKEPGASPGRVTKKERDASPVSIFIAQRRVRELRSCVILDEARGDATPEEAATVEVIARGIEDAATKAGVDEPFNADLISGLISSRTDGNPTEEQSQTLGAYVRWSSRPFTVNSTRLDRDHFTVRLAGRFGRAPVTALLAESGAEIKATEVPAFVWDARLEFRGHGERTDWFAYAGGGQTWLVNEAVFAKGSAGQAVLMLSGGKVAWNGEAGVAVNMFREDRLSRLAGRDGEARMSLSLGYKRDALLRDARNFGLNNERLVFRLVLAQLRVFDRRDNADKPGPFSIRFGVEHERGWNGRGAPSATRLLIAGDLNIVQALK